MKRIALKHLSLSGGAHSSSVEFNDSFTLIHGPSESGKSFIFESMDYALGATELRKIDELAQYENVLLAFTTNEAEEFTLCRTMQSGAITVYVGHHYHKPEEVGIPLKQKHRHGDLETVSGYMLALCGFDKWSLYKASSGETTSLSFRELAHVTFSAETRMQARTSPFEFGVSTAAPKERSLVRSLLTGTSDPAPEKSALPKKEVKQGQLELITRVLQTLADDPEVDTSDSLLKVAEREELGEQLRRLDFAIDEVSEPLSKLGDLRGELATRLTEETRRLQTITTRSAELSELSARFALLEAQYVSDLDRLEMIEEAGWVLAQEAGQVCPLCGTALSVVDGAAHRQVEASVLYDSVHSERDRTNKLLEGLRATIADISGQVERIVRVEAGSQTRVVRFRSELKAVDSRSVPTLRDLRELQAKRNEVQRRLDVVDQIEALLRIREDVEEEGNGAKFQMPQVDFDAIRTFESEVREMLQTWNVEGASDTYVDPKSFELNVGGKPRRDRGKGMRAVLNAASLLGLAQYCLKNGLPHPGFVVLDSPLVTYKDPKVVPTLEDEAAPDTVISAFYKYLDTNFQGQCVVMENTEPQGAVSNGTIIEFTGTGIGRRGFIE